MPVGKTITSKLAVLTALGFLAGGLQSARAADLGGNCCADLEERIAELEATTARKGNRKVSLEVSGHVNEAIMFWDDGFESNAYVVTNDNSRSRFRFKGEAKIDGDWKAGYLLEIGVRAANSKRFTQDNPKGNDNPSDVGLDVRHSTWYITNKNYGKLSVGQTGGAAEGVTESNLAQTKDVAKYSDQEDTGLGLFLRRTDGTQTTFSWRRLLRDNGDQPGEGRRSTLVKYDTPELMGFKATVNWGEDDFWEVGMRYEGEVSGFKIAAGLAYGENTEVKTATGSVGFECLSQAVATGAACHQIGGSVSVMHVASGLYVNFGAGQLTDERINAQIGAAADDTSTFWALEAGIEQKWNSLGKTTLFGQFYDDEGGTNGRRKFSGATILNTEMQSWSVGMVQGIDAAAMHLYLFYRHYEADMTTSAAVQPVFEDLDVVTAGAIIRF